MSRFPRADRLTIEVGLAWCMAACAFFEEACRTGDKDQFRAAGTIGYGLHNLPGMLQQIQAGKTPSTCAYGDMSHRSESPEVRAMVRSFFKQDVPAVALPAGTEIPESLGRAIYSTMQAFRLGFRRSSAFATEEGWDERRQTCLQIAVAMQTHLNRWLAGEEFDAEAFQKDGGWL